MCRRMWDIFIILMCDTLREDEIRECKWAKLF